MNDHLNNPQFKMQWDEEKANLGNNAYFYIFGEQGSTVFDFGEQGNKSKVVLVMATSHFISGEHRYIFPWGAGEQPPPSPRWESLEIVVL